MDTNYNALTTAFTASATHAARVIQRIFAGYNRSMAVRLWNGETISIGKDAPRFTIVFNSPGVFRKLCFRQEPLHFVEAYFTGAIDIEGDFYQALELETAFSSASLNPVEKLKNVLDLLRISNIPEDVHAYAPSRPKRLASLPSTSNRLPHANSAQSIEFHYDLSNDFYRLWLDQQMVYSCAYFKTTADTIDEAQANKLDHICRKLRLREGDKLLDIGCGWGALAIWAAQHYGANVTGITLSRRQHQYAAKRVMAEHLQERVSIELLDYRNLVGSEVFDRVSSIGMFEHVGLRNLSQYFSIVHRLLKPGGLFLNHGITHDEEGWRTTLSTKFINHYVFPDGELDTVSNVQRRMENAQFEIWDVEGLRPHYAITLRRWVARLEATHQQALNFVDESTYRIWRLYMAACARHFEQGDVGIYQILASKRTPYTNPVPLTREDLYLASSSE